jgi:hypothetical protein
MTKKTMSLGGLLLAALAATASADAPNPMAPLDPIVGSWKFAGTMSMGKDAAKVNATWTCKRVSAKAGISCTLDLKGIPGMASYAETDLFGFEPGSGTFHWFSVTNAGETHDHVAKVAEGGKLQFIYTGTQEGKPFKEVVDTEIAKDGKTMSLRSESFVDGKSVAVLEGKGKK